MLAGSRCGVYECTPARMSNPLPLVPTQSVGTRGNGLLPQCTGVYLALLNVWQDEQSYPLLVWRGCTALKE